MGHRSCRTADAAPTASDRRLGVPWLTSAAIANLTLLPPATGPEGGSWTFARLGLAARPIP